MASTAGGDRVTSPEDAKLMDKAIEQLMTNALVTVMEGLETLLVYTRNLINFPDEKKYRKIKTSNIHYQERLGHLSGASLGMNAIGYVENGDYLRLDESRISKEGNMASLQFLEKKIAAALDGVKAKFALLPKRTEVAHVFTSVAGAGTASSIGKRQSMEDDEIIVDAFCGDAKQGFFGLYDGHGGRATVDFVVRVLHMNLEHALRRDPQQDLAVAYKTSYLATDGQLRRKNILRSGSTSVTCVIRTDSTGKKVLHTANVGDSRAVLAREGKAIRLTIDHKATLPEEAKRITDGGGFIGRNKRVNGVLAISRALGDHMLKANDVVSAAPYCTTTELETGDKFVLLACDGIWDVMTDQAAIDLVEKRVDELSVAHSKATGKAPSGAALNTILTTVCKDLVDMALELRTMDNVTAMLVKL